MIRLFRILPVEQRQRAASNRQLGHHQIRAAQAIVFHFPHAGFIVKTLNERRRQRHFSTNKKFYFYGKTLTILLKWTIKKIRSGHVATTKSADKPECTALHTSISTKLTKINENRVYSRSFVFLFLSIHSRQARVRPVARERVASDVFLVR